MIEIRANTQHKFNKIIDDCCFIEAILQPSVLHEKKHTLATALSFIPSRGIDSHPFKSARMLH